MRSDDEQIDPTKVIGKHCAERVQEAVKYAAGRCNSEEDAMKRLRVEEVDRSRRRLPQYVVWVDGQRVWTGAYERMDASDDAAMGERLVWLERWHSYAASTLPPEHRWRAEPEHQCTEVTNDEHGRHWVAKVRRPSGNAEDETAGIATMFVARAASPEAAIAAVYEMIDSGTASPSESETVQ